MREMARIDRKKSPMSPSHDNLSNKKLPPNPIAAARARQSIGKIFLPPMNVMNEVEQYRLSKGSESDDEDDNQEAEIYDV